MSRVILNAFVAQLGERKTEDLKVRGSIPRGGIFFILYFIIIINIMQYKAYSIIAHSNININHFLR